MAKIDCSYDGCGAFWRTQSVGESSRSQKAHSRAYSAIASILRSGRDAKSKSLWLILPPLFVLLKDTIATFAILATEHGITTKAKSYYAPKGGLL